jgi:UDP-galactopyranose mutase
MTDYDWLIVGAGFTGAVLAERLANKCGARVLLVDRRDHIGGNAYDTRNEAGLLYHKYGPHVFHTNSKAIFDYLSQFTAWTPYEHKTLGLIKERLVPIPFNLTSLSLLFPRAEAARLTGLLIGKYGLEANVPILDLKSAADSALNDLAAFIYENVFYGYTTKQWGLTPEQLSPSVTGRVPVRVSYDDRYFLDAFQCMPSDGYTPVFERMLKSKNIDVVLNTGFKDVKAQARFKRVIYTGAIDEFFDYELGALPYRSLDFDFQTHRQKRHQLVCTVNYPTSQKFTRITEMGYLTQEWGDLTTLALEYPQEHVPNKTEPYYPIPREENNVLHNKYIEFARREAPEVTFAGRLGDYKYYNMDQAIGRALSLFDKISEDMQA